MKKCKHCGHMFPPKSKTNAFCSIKCQRANYNRRKRTGKTTSQEYFTAAKLEDRELSSIQLRYIAEDVAKGMDIQESAAVFGWTRDKGFVIFKSKLKEKKQEFERYLKAAK